MRSTRINDTRAGTESGEREAVCPRGTTLTTTRGVGREVPARVACGERLRRDMAVAIEIALEATRVAEKDVVRVELIALAAEAADRLQPVDELRLGLRAARAPARRRSGPRGEPLDLFDDRPLDLGQRVAGRGGRDDLEEAGRLARLLEGRDFGGERACS